MIDFEKLKGEYTVLAYLVMCADRARDIMRRAAMNASLTDGESFNCGVILRACCVCMVL